MLYLTSLSFIDFVPDVHFKTKHNLFLNELHDIVLHISCISSYFFKKINKFAICTYINLVNLD